MALWFGIESSTFRSQVWCVKHETENVISQTDRKILPYEYLALNDD